MTTLRLISSMATKPLLADLVALYQAQAPGMQVQVESVGGVDAAKRVQAGEAFDGVVLASNCLLYTSPSPRDTERSRMPSSA